MPSVDDPVAIHHFSPVLSELDDIRPLAVDGAVPPVLDGLYLRNGPNAHPEGSSAGWWTGDGMVHAVELRDGVPVSHLSRWVRTRRLCEATGQRPPPGPSDPVPGPANANIVWHGGRLLALDGTGFPYRLTTELRTVQVEDYDGTLGSPMCARPKIDPVTGAMASIGTDPYGPPYLRYHEHDAAGDLVHVAELDTDGATWQPDFAMTASRVVLFQTPARFDDRYPHPTSGLPYRTDPERPLEVAVVERGTAGLVRWVETAAGIPLQVANAYDDGDTVVMDVLVADGMPDGPAETYGARFERWWVTAAGVTSRSLIDDMPAALVTIDPSLEGRPHRYAYGLEPSPVGARVLVRYDRVRDEKIRWEAGMGRLLSEPVFVRDPDGRADDEGWLLLLCYDPERNGSDLVILDASSPRGRPEALIHLAGRVPGGLHAGWLPAPRYR